MVIYGILNIHMLVTPLMYMHGCCLSNVSIDVNSQKEVYVFYVWSLSELWKDWEGVNWTILIFQLYPSGVWFLFYKGRLEFMKGNLEKAVISYKQSWKSQDLWPQFHHICFWELLWVEWWYFILRTIETTHIIIKRLQFYLPACL